MVDEGPTAGALGYLEIYTGCRRGEQSIRRSEGGEVRSLGQEAEGLAVRDKIRCAQQTLP